MRKNHILIFISILLYSIAAMAQQEYAEHSRLSSGQWHKIGIATEGVYKLTTADIADLSGKSCDKIAIFGASGGAIAEDRRIQTTDDIIPIAIILNDANNNGIFDNEDYIIFYGEGANIWKQGNGNQTFVYTQHPYAKENFYYLTTDLEENNPQTRIATTSLTPTLPIDIETYTALALYHPDNINTHGSGQIWVADKFASSITSRNYSLSLPSIPVNNSATLRYAIANTSSNAARFDIACGNNRAQEYMGNGANYYAESMALDNIHNKDLTINVSYTPQASGSEGYLDFLELSATVPLEYQSGVLIARNNQTYPNDAACRFLARGKRDGITVWDVTDKTQPTALPIEASGTSAFTFVASCSQTGTFAIFTPNELPHPTNISLVTNQDIHGAEVPDYVIVAHKDFLQQAENLADLHRIHEGLDVLVVSQDEVFNEFSSGKADPLAIRKMMQCLRQKDSESVKPKYLLLFGKGTYDNRDIEGNHQRTVVTYQTPASFDSEGGAFPSDDPAGYLDQTAGGIFEGPMTVSIGRLPAKTVAEADHMVKKIERYITRSDFEDASIRGDWRNYVALLADDADPSCPSDSVFASDSEKTAQEIKRKYPQFNIDRIFADAYIQQSGADGSYYPDVNNALRQRMNYGCLLLDYIGHGSSSYIGTERYMEFTDIEKYSNTHQLPLFVTSTCSFGHYDLTEGICGAEAVLLADAAGIGTIAAARPIHHNQRFNTNCCTFALDPNNTIGDALRLAKNITQVSHCIALFGDPALHLSVPRNKVVVTAINHRAVDSAVVDSAKVLSRVTVEGEIRGADNMLVSNFDGTIYPIVFDREVACRTLANDNDSTEVNFWQQKNMLYKGRETVKNGKFEYSFIIPRDVAYKYDFAKLSHYAQSENDNATGQYGNIMFGGFNDDAELTEIHPKVKLWLGDTNFRNGGLTNETPTLYARLTDSVGINAAGSGLGHDITAIIDGNPYSTVTLNDYYEPNILDSRCGEVYYTLGKIEEGHHTLTLKCWNIFNYSGSATIDFVVTNDKKFKAGDITATPNPAHGQTLIRFEHNMTNQIAEATISIYDIRGALVRQFSPNVVANSSVISCPWDFSSANGCQVSQGIYIVRGDIITADGQRFCQTGKIVRH